LTACQASLQERVYAQSLGCSLDMALAVTDRQNRALQKTW
jgi:hypothetical protein